MYLTRHDLKLPLDLTRTAELALLREHLHHEPAASLSETPALGADGWLGGRANEITVQLHSTRLHVPARIPGRRVHPVRPDAGPLPGASAWLYARIYGNLARQDEILHEQLPHLLRRWTTPTEWWFIRHTDDGPHLRLRLRLPEAAAFTLAGERVGEWTMRLRAAGLATRLQLDTYQPETGRYGSGTAMNLAEQVFAADSRVALLQLTHAQLARVDVRAVTAAGLVALAAGLLGTEGGVDWLIDHLPHGHGARVGRDLHQQAVRLGAPAGSWAELRESASGRDVLQAWEARARTLGEYRHHLDQDGELNPADVLGSLLHLHYVRMLGIDRDGERLARHLARAAATAASARRLAGAR
ncbi:thiopeptide-type bacteriocin biosynthesis protein [Kitasatospora sp. NPDC002040]|uniref:thiopeptide-type bacteriocin biosynthesis protein n=1 Tax=Kitasatospora sp. NPDC002040 TaxID=3154661 RepID=UPI003324DB83